MTKIETKRPDAFMTVIPQWRVFDKQSQVYSCDDLCPFRHLDQQTGIFICSEKFDKKIGYDYYGPDPSKCKGSPDHDVNICCEVVE